MVYDYVGRIILGVLSFPAPRNLSNKHFLTSMVLIDVLFPIAEAVCFSEAVGKTWN